MSETFDYVIVGAGTAGCVLASRLSEDPNLTVCLIEAGGPATHPFIHIPAAVGAAIATPSLNWRFLTTPQPKLNGRRIPIPRGHVVGGSGSINGMVYHRGYPTDFDDWARAGNTGWTHREVLPYFLRSEGNSSYRGSPWHRADGPVSVTYISNPNPLNRAFLEGMASLGQFRPCDDFNGPDPEGYGMRQGTIRNGRRASTAAAYLEPARRRPNLRVLTDALVSKVVIDQGRASAVEFELEGALRRVAARREVVVSAGAIQSPQVLMLSGVGDGEELRRHGIEVKHPLPGVGGNLHDHLAVGVLMEMHDSQSYGISLRTVPRGAWNLLQYALYRGGPLASNVFESNAFIRSRAGLQRPDLQIVFQPARRNKGTFPFPLGHGFAVNTVNLYPKSRGRIRLASANPHDHPLIDPNLLGDDEDLAPLVRGLVLSRRVIASSAFARYRAVEVAPGPEAQGEAQLGDYVRRTASTVHHPVGTCRMGTDADSVVDSQLRVRGVERLRVVDASAFPSIIGGNTNATVVMMAEKAADMMLGVPAPAAMDDGLSTEQRGMAYGR
jgi:choline dehydrogenase-like flavoprotein